MSFPNDLFDWLSNRKPRLVPDDWKDSPDNWAAGDIAICNDAQGCNWRSGFTGEVTEGPAPGERNAVQCVLIMEGRQFLRFGKWPTNWYLSAAFRKARPDAVEGSKKAWRDILRRHSQKVAA